MNQPAVEALFAQTQNGTAAIYQAALMSRFNVAG
jgi:hypothetical protein